MANYNLIFSFPTKSHLTTTFWEKVDIRDTNECWPYKPPSRTQRGYGASFYGDIRTTAHRIAWFLARGPFPKVLHVLHRCDNPICCNPGHLWLGTPQDNMDDMVRKGRASRGSKTPRGEDNPNSRLRDDQLAQLFEDAKTMSQRKVAEKYGISKSQVGNILRGESRPNAMDSLPDDQRDALLDANARRAKR